MTNLPKVGIRPTIDGRLGGVRESLEDQTMNMAKATAKLIASKLRYPTGDPVKCVNAFLAELFRAGRGNDGSPAPGEPPLGPFYELETSSPGAELAPGASLTHKHVTVHFAGQPEQLDLIAKAKLGAGIAEIRDAFVGGQ